MSGYRGLHGRSDGSGSVIEDYGVYRLFSRPAAIVGVTVPCSTEKTTTLATWRGKGLNGSKARNDSLDVKFPGHSSLTSSRLLEPESKYKR